MCRLETVTTVPHEDPVRGRDRVRGICAACKYLAFSWPACVPASAGVTLVTAPTSRIAHHAPRARRRVLGCGYGPRQRVAPECSKRLKAETRPRGPVYRRSRDAATACAVCAAWKVLVRGAGAEASESTRVKREAEQLPMRLLGFRLGYIKVSSYLY